MLLEESVLILPRSVYAFLNLACFIPIYTAVPLQDLTSGGCWHSLACVWLAPASASVVTLLCPVSSALYCL